MKESESLLAEEIKKVVIEANNEMFGNLDEIDFKVVLREAKLRLKLNSKYNRIKAIENLGLYVSGDDSDLENALNILENHKDQGDVTGYIDGIQMVHGFEHSFTVKTLLQEIYLA